MPSLSERLKATDKLTIHTVEEDGGTFAARHIPEPLYERLLVLSLLVEAFQAAEREQAAAEAESQPFARSPDEVKRIIAAEDAYEAAKARLLEVNGMHARTAVGK